MRVIGGKHKGRALIAPKGRTTRPTADRTREGVFNVLVHASDAPSLDGARVADIFAGSGALGLEALSRGAVHCVFVENNRPALDLLRDNIAALGETENATVLGQQATSLGAPPGGGVDIAFFDAPYGKGLSETTLHRLRENGWFNEGAVAVVETGKGEPLSAEGFTSWAEKTYGAATVYFLAVD